MSATSVLPVDAANVAAHYAYQVREVFKKCQDVSLGSTLLSLHNLDLPEPPQALANLAAVVNQNPWDYLLLERAYDEVAFAVVRNPANDARRRGWYDTKASLKHTNTTPLHATVDELNGRDLGVVLSTIYGLYDDLDGIEKEKNLGPLICDRPRLTIRREYRYLVFEAWLSYREPVAPPKSAPPKDKEEPTWIVAFTCTGFTRYLRIPEGDRAIDPDIDGMTRMQEATLFTEVNAYEYAKMMHEGKILAVQMRRGKRYFDDVNKP